MKSDYKRPHLNSINKKHILGYNQLSRAKKANRVKLSANFSPVIRSYNHSNNSEPNRLTVALYNPHLRRASQNDTEIHSQSFLESTPEKLKTTIEFPNRKNLNFLIISKFDPKEAHSELTKKRLINESYCIDPQYLANYKPKTRIFSPVELKPKPQMKPSVPNYPPLTFRKPTSRKPEIMSIKEAMRDREWLVKAKDEINRDFMSAINKSNGLSLCRPEENFFTYKFYLGPGNNSYLVKQLMATRPQWTRVPKEEKDEAHFVWTQWRDKEYLEILPSLKDEPQEESTIKQSITCVTRYEMAHVNNNLEPGKIVDMSPLGFDLLTMADSYSSVKPVNYRCEEMKIHNRIELNFHLVNKKGLYYSLKSYYEALERSVGEVMPLTFHVLNQNDGTFKEFLKTYNENFANEVPNFWILKPGENSNRGTGISLCSSLDQITHEVQTQEECHTTIIQYYIPNPFLVFRRKFDIRCFTLVTCFNGVLQAYFYEEGYLRTTSAVYSLNNTKNKYIHLTNDAVQKKSDDYGKFENGNKMSYSDFERYLDNHHHSKVNFYEEILPKIREIVKDTIKAVAFKINFNKKAHTFEVLGYDFILDSELKPWILEVNTNPCLELSSPQLARIIPSMLENAFRIALDPIFMESTGARRASPGLISDPLLENKFQLIFHSLVDGANFQQELEANGNLHLLTTTHPLVSDDWTISETEEEVDSELEN